MELPRQDQVSKNITFYVVFKTIFYSFALKEDVNVKVPQSNTLEGCKTHLSKKHELS